MIPKIKNIQMKSDYFISVSFDDGKCVLYDLKDDMKKLPGYSDLSEIPGLYENIHLDESRTCIYWNDYIDLPSDIIYEYGTETKSAGE